MQAKHKPKENCQQTGEKQLLSTHYKQDKKQMSKNTNNINVKTHELSKHKS